MYWHQNLKPCINDVNCFHVFAGDCRRHSVYCSGCPSVCTWSHTHKVCEHDVFQTFLHQIYNLGAVGDKNEPSRCWGQKVKGQFHDKSKYRPLLLSSIIYCCCLTAVVKYKSKYEATPLIQNLNCGRLLSTDTNFDKVKVFGTGLRSKFLSNANYRIVLKSNVKSNVKLQRTDFEQEISSSDARLVSHAASLYRVEVLWCRMLCSGSNHAVQASCMSWTKQRPTLYFTLLYMTSIHNEN